MRETTRHRTAFNAYLNLGASRSLEALRTLMANERGHHGFARPPSIRSLARWSKELHWQDRLADLEREARLKDAEAYVQALREMNDRQAREGLLLQQKGVQRFQSLAQAELSPSEAIRALAEGSRLERLARGEVTDRTQIEREQENDFTGFSIAELRAIADAALQSARGGSQTEP
jgi:hypothetical protein